MKSDVQVIFFGTSEFAVPILEKLAQSSWRPALVVTAPDAPAGRGRELRPPPVKIAADRLGLPVIQPADLKIENWNLKIPEADLFIAAAYGKILPPELLKIPKRGSLNIHPSLLPRRRGPSPVQYAILHGDEETGVTIILMDKEADHGPIVRSSKLEILNSKPTTPELTARLADVGAELLLETIPEWLEGKIIPRPQEHTAATYSRMLKKEDGHIDWSKGADEIERMVRAFQPWPGAYAFWQRGNNKVRLAIEESEIRNEPAFGRTKAGPGKLEARSSVGTVFEDAGALLVQTGDGVLVIKRLKPEGKKSTAASEFLRGHRDIIGAKLE